MAIVLKPPQRRLLPVGKVAIDWSHPLTNGLVGCYIPGVTLNNLTGKGGDLTRQSGVTLDNNQEGPCVTQTTTAGLIATTPAAFYAGNNFSIYWRGFVSANSDAYAPVFMVTDINSWGGGYIFLGFRAGGSGTTTNIGMCWDAGGSFNSTPLTGWTAGQVNSVAATADYTGTKPIHGFTNGVRNVSTGLGAAYFSPSATSQICFGCEPAGGDNAALRATANIGYWWTRTLADEEIAQLDLDPYAFLIPAEGEMPALRTSAAAPTVVPIPLEQITPAPKRARAIPTQATQFAVPPPAAAASGTLATTEAPDIAAFTGTGAAAPSLFGWYQPLSIALKRALAWPTQATQFAVPRPIAGVSGSWATTEAPDIAAFTGTFAALPQFIPLVYDAGGIRPRYVYYQALVNPLRPPSIAGILAVTEAPDTASFTATYAVTGILAVTEGQDIAAFTGSGVAPSGTLAVTEAPDTASFTGNFVVSGTLATTEAQDTASFTGSAGLPTTGTLAVTEASDSVVFTGSVAAVPAGILAVTEIPDNVVFLIDYMPPPTTTSPMPYPSIYDYGWYDRRPPLRRGHGPGR